ncbi:MAG: 4-hydroxy-tetrahydrodipicolinate synthase [Bacteroidia bacterium]|nr:4-hydroxy-tetrahydrodipicolinate synthase [Bacteroidia bacterium]
MKFIGTGVAVITPFTQSGEIDFKGINNIVHHLTEGGVEYLVVLGSTGEAATLNASEKQQVLEAYLKANNGNLPVVVGAGGNDTREVCQQVDFFTQNYPGISGILSVSPYYNKPSQEGIYQHYKAVSESTSLPVILYNVPGRTGSNISAQTTIRLAENCKNVHAIKEASGNLEQIMEIIRYAPSGFQVISGDDALTLPIIACGGKGVISVVAHAAPYTFSEMVRFALNGNLQEAKKLHYSLWDWYSTAFAEGNPVSIKAILECAGICSRQVRLPLVKGSETLTERIQASRFLR